MVRAFVQHRPALPWKAWYVAPNFRAEQPQAGRYRQFWQFDVEAIGDAGPGIDAEIIGHWQNKNWKIEDPKEVAIAATTPAGPAT